MLIARGSGFDEIVISQPGGTRPRRLPIAAPQCSWELSAAGSFSAFVHIDDFRAAGLPPDIRDYWVEYASLAGRWGGIVVANPMTDGVVEIAAEGFAGLMAGRTIDLGVEMIGSAGGCARRVLTEAGLVSASLLTLGTFDEGGRLIQVTLSGDAGLDLLPQIAEQGDAEWMVDADRIFSFARRLGRDLSHQVRLREDRHIADYTLSDDPVFVRAASVGVPTLAAGAESAPPAWENVPVGIGARHPGVPADHEQPLPTNSASFTVTNAEPWVSWCALGATVRVDLGSIGVSGRFRIRSMALDVPSNALHVAGELLKEV